MTSRESVDESLFATSDAVALANTNYRRPLRAGEDPVHGWADGSVPLHAAIFQQDEVVTKTPTCNSLSWKVRKGSFNSPCPLHSDLPPRFAE